MTVFSVCRVSRRPRPVVKVAAVMAVAVAAAVKAAAMAEEVMAEATAAGGGAAGRCVVRPRTIFT